MATNATALPPYLQDQLAHASDDRRPWEVIVTALCIPLIWIVVALRFLARYYSAWRYGWDDWTMIIALFFGTGFLVIDYLGSVFGGGRHVVLIVLDPLMFVSYAKNTLAAEIMYPIALLGPKISLLLLYRRIFPSKGFLWSLIAVGTVTVAYTLCSVIVPLGQCIPIQKIWDISVSGTCINITAALTTFGVLNILTDAAILTMPIPMIWRLQTTLGTKAQLSALFLTGTLVTVISIARVIYTSRIDIQDVTWTQAEAVVWTSAEVCTAIISACLPTYRPLFDKSKRNRKRTRYSSHRYASTGETGKSIGLEDGLPLHQITVQTDIYNTWADNESSHKS